jgi:LacI family transcriptional regulator
MALKVRNVAMIIDASQPYDRKIVQGVAAYVREVGRWSIYLEEGRQQRIPDLRRWAGDGIIADFDDRDTANALRRAKIPVVGIGGGCGWYDPRSGIPYFVSNEEAIARMAAEHLLERGFSHMAFCGFPRTKSNPWSSARERAFQECVERAGANCSTYTGRHCTARNWEALQRDLADWLDSLPKPLGLMACDDVRARHVLEACRRLNLRVPDDVAVIGVDNNEMICDLSTPPLSSVEQGLRRMGYEAAALLDQLMAGRKPAKLRYVIDPEAVVTRRSTDVLAVEDADVSAAVRLIRDRADMAIFVPEVARAAGLSRSTLERKFQAALGRSVHAEIHRVRMDRLRQLVAATDVPLKQVGAQMGFKHLPYMTRVFRRQFGCTPACYRRQARIARES